MATKRVVLSKDVILPDSDERVRAGTPVEVDVEVLDRALLPYAGLCESEAAWQSKRKARAEGKAADEQLREESRTEARESRSRKASGKKAAAEK